MTTQFEREILTHHYVSSAPFPRPTKAYEEAVLRFCKLELLRYNMPENRYEANLDAMAVYMEALAAVPLPVMRWEIPHFTPPASAPQDK